MRLSISAIWFLLAAVCSYADTYLRQPAVDVLHYDISLELSDTSDSIAGTTRIHVRVRNDGVSSMRLDFAGMQVDSLQVQGVQRSFSFRDGSLSFDFGRKYARNEIAIVAVHYHGKPEHGLMIGSNKYGRRVFFAENWPDYAHYWFPSIDHPSDKATVQVTVTAPQKYDVVSNGSLVQTKLLQDGRKRTRWVERKPIPVYCIVIGAAEFSIARQPRVNGVPLAWYFYAEDSGAATRKFNRTASALAYFSSLIGPYPYKKLAQVQATVSFDGMENSSAIFYRESLFQETPASETPLPHEIAHQWFGNSVTEIDWDHLWLSEGFATYFEALFREHLEGPGSLKETMAGHAKNLILSEFARSEPVIDPAQTDVMQKLNPLNYQKGAWILHMLRGMLGDAQFFRGIRRYYSLYEGGNASSEDFQKAMESVSGISLSTFFKQWLYQSGWPEYILSWRWNQEAGAAEISVRQGQATGLFDMTVDIAFEMENGKEVRKLHICDAEHVFRIPLPSKPLSVTLDPDGWLLKSVEVESR
jgi:aminopeptidase N